MMGGVELGMARRRAVQGAALALGAPLGWLLIELLRGHALLGALAERPDLYLYLLGGTLLSFVVFGFVLGRAEDRLAASRDELAKLSTTDALTGLRNRRYFDARLAEACADATRHRRPLSLVILDLDFFKSVNDRFGHAAGDRVLAQVGAAVHDAARSGDTAARIGGEELALLLPGTDEAAARVVAERLLATIRSAPIPLGERGDARITASAGIGAPDLRGDGGPDALFAAADAALYRAKAEGRDRVANGARPATGS